MLSPDQISAKYLADVTELTLLLPRNRHESSILAYPTEGGVWSVFLDGSHAFNGFKSSGNESWSGMAVTGIRFEVDHTAIFNPTEESPRFGSLIREKERLSIFAQVGAGHFHQGQRIPILDNLSKASETQSVGFLKWRIVVGDAYIPEELFSVDLVPMDAS